MDYSLYEGAVFAVILSEPMLRKRFAKVLAVCGLAGVLTAQAPPSRDKLDLRGDRFKPLTYNEMTPEQKAMIDHLLSGERGTVTGPFNVLLRSPEMGDLAQKFGAEMRFHSSIPRKLNEFAILITARHWTSQYEWFAHHRDGLKYGLEPAVIDALAAGNRPAMMDADEEIVYNFCTEVLRNKQVSDTTFKAAKDRFGEKGVVDLIGTMGYYNMVSMLLNVDRYPLPDGEKPQLKPLP
jgi:4-carboxymuconolactone decarboxylase